MKRKFISTIVMCVTFTACILIGFGSPSAAYANQDMHRLYNPNSGEHFYTASAEERDWLVGLGWNHEGTGWVAPETSSTPVFRLYNTNAGDHHYTMSASERDWLVNLGWNYEGIGWYSDDAQTVPLYRQYNPNASTGSHNYTTSKSENDWLVSLGWNTEGIGWYGVNTNEPTKQKIWVPEQGHYEDMYETVHVPAVTHEEPVYITVIDQEEYTTYITVYYTKDGWSGTDRDEARAHLAKAGGHLQWENIEEYHPAITHQEQIGTTTVIDKPAHDEQRKIGTKWVVDIPGHWE